MATFLLVEARFYPHLNDMLLAPETVQPLAEVPAIVRAHNVGDGDALGRKVHKR